MDLIKAWRRARSRAVPLVAVSTADQRETASLVADNSNGSPVVAWDVLRGFTAMNEEGVDAVGRVLGEAPPQVATDPAAALDLALNGAPEDTVIIMFGGNRVIEGDGPGGGIGAWRGVQALVNLRDDFKATSRTLCLLGPSFALPPELVNDTLQVDHELPGEGRRAEIVQAIVDSANAANIEEAGETGGEPPVIDLDEEQLRRATTATRGLSAFACEQAAALSTTKDHLDHATLRAWWKKTINQVEGLDIDESGHTLDDIVGLDNLKDFIGRVMAGKNPPGAIVRVDEIEKALGGSDTDTSGVSQDFLGQLLTFMEESNASGLIAFGPPGSGKSLSSVAAGAAGGVPTITLDVNGLKGSLVGESERKARAAFRTIRALAGRTFWIATCNRTVALKPELRRRFRFGIWMFDIPSEEQQDALWKHYTAKFEVEDIRPEDGAELTGAEIRNLCETANDMGITPREAAAYIVPVSVQAAEEIEALRRQASGKYISADYAGAYKMPQRRTAGAAKRKFSN